MTNAKPEPVHQFGESFWEWDPQQGGYHPISCEWWEWFPGAEVLKPVNKDGWTWHPEKGVSGDWVRDDASD